MSRLNNDSSTFDDLRDRVREEMARGRFQAALDLCDEAIRWARTRDDADTLDLALLNRSGILVAQGEGAQVVGQLRKILLRSTQPTNCFLASFSLSRFHELRQETDRGRFYASLSLDHARRSERQDFLALGHNQLGNLQLLDCYFDQACESYLDSLALAPDHPTVEQAITISNIGYCRVVTGEHRTAFANLFQSLRLMRHLQADLWEVLPRLGLSYAYLDIHKLPMARKHAVRALSLAEATTCKEHIMNSLFLLGETEKQIGNELAAFEHFNRLQQDYYPEKPFIADLLMTTDIRPLINLMA